jgi:catechol 2,3-dioxygenase-like lactoylglutathione lyase family enzyme
MTLRWSHAVLYVRDLEAMIGFYRDVLGFEVSDRGPLDPAAPGLEIVFLSQVATDHHQLAFVPVRGDGPPSTVDHMAFRVESLADVKAMAARLAADGRAQGLQALSHGNAWSVYFRDPEGNGLEVFCDSPWHVRQPQVRPWDLETSEEELRRRTEAAFRSEPDFQPIESFYAGRRARFGG